LTLVWYRRGSIASASLRFTSRAFTTVENDDVS
jgi:hypothetical protein